MQNFIDYLPQQPLSLSLFPSVYGGVSSTFLKLLWSCHCILLWWEVFFSSRIITHRMWKMSVLGFEKLRKKSPSAESLKNPNIHEIPVIIFHNYVQNMARDTAYLSILAHAQFNPVPHSIKALQPTDKLSLHSASKHGSFGNSLLPRPNCHHMHCSAG